MENLVDVEWQRKCDEAIKDENFVLLSSPTGSGKTGRFMKWALGKIGTFDEKGKWTKNEENKEDVIYITAPIKALSNQRWRELKAAGYSVGLETGDIKYIPDGCDIICCTQEIYNNKYSKEKNCPLIIDEGHYMYENEERARVYIDTLHNTKAQNIFICSATLGNIQEVSEYMNFVSGKNFFVYDNDKRLTTLHKDDFIPMEEIKDAFVVAFSKAKCKKIAGDLYEDRRDYDDRDEETIESIVKEIEDIKNKYWINDADLVEMASQGIAYYYGAMLPKEKLFVEELFEKRLIDTVVGTDALALGVNFPIQNVVFTQLAKRIGGRTFRITKNSFDQLAGRAGRFGYFNEGYVCFCDEFVDDRGDPIEEYGYETEELFEELFKAPNEDVHITLTPNIGRIISGETTKEEDAAYIIKYSTDKVDYDSVLKDITEQIDYIYGYDIFTHVVYEDVFGKDYDKCMAVTQYSKKNRPATKRDEQYVKEHSLVDFSTVKQKEKKKMDKIREEIETLGVEEEFVNNISRVYMEEFTPQKNCRIFIDILLGKSLAQLIYKYSDNTRDFYELLQLRKYLMRLPEEYRVRYDLEELERKIDNIDHTALHIGEEIISMAEIQQVADPEIFGNQLSIAMRDLGLIIGCDNDRGSEENQEVDGKEEPSTDDIIQE